MNDDFGGNGDGRREKKITEVETPWHSYTKCERAKIEESVSERERERERVWVSGGCWGGEYNVDDGETSSRCSGASHRIARGIWNHLRKKEGGKLSKGSQRSARGQAVSRREWAKRNKRTWGPGATKKETRRKRERERERERERFEQAERNASEWETEWERESPK